MAAPIPPRYQEMIDHGYEFKIGDYINRGFEIFRKDPGPFIGYGAVVFFGMMILAFIPIVGALALLVLVMPLIAGFYHYANKVANDEPRTFRDFFAGFNQIGSLLGLMLLMALVVGLGFIALIIPGIYLGVAYGFALPLVALGGMGAWDAMELSRKIIHKNWWWFLLFSIIVSVISSIGQVALLIGVFVTMPIAYCVQYAAFEDIMGQPESHSAYQKIDEIGKETPAEPVAKEAPAKPAPAPEEEDPQDDIIDPLA
ncbi:MAG: hypothetical protein D6722_23675 [Bacteroidetes bacterium]|nr:MAG: hypothetical protein D6722_23675 [Bacteroidota bacterium]